MPKAYFSANFKGYFSQPVVLHWLSSFGPTSDFRWYFFFQRTRNSFFSLIPLTNISGM